MSDHIIVSPQAALSPPTPKPPPPAPPAPEKAPPPPPPSPKTKDFALSKPKAEKEPSTKAVEKLKSFYSTKVYLVTSEEEYVKESLFFDRLRGAIDQKIHKCVLANMDKAEELRQLEEAVANNTSVAVVGTKEALRLYPKLKAQHQKKDETHHLIHSPLIFIKITDDPEEKKQLWKEIKKYTLR